VTEWREGSRGKAPRQAVEEEERAGRTNRGEEGSKWPLAN
jgi:hypothetical protein